MGGSDLTMASTHGRFRVLGRKPGQPWKDRAQHQMGRVGSSKMCEPELSEEECKEKVAAVLPETCVQHLESNNWKERISSMETLQKTIREMKKSEIPCQALVRLLSRGSKETKLQVMQKKLHTITLLAQEGDFSRTSAQIVLESVVEMVGDVLCSTSAQGALTAIAEACSLPWTAQTAMALAFSQSNSRIQTKILDWLSKAILEFGFAGMEAKTLVNTLRIALAAVQPSVQRSAITLLGVIYLYMGDSLRELMESEKLPLLPQIDAELEKVQRQVPPAPSRANPKPGLGDGIQEDSGDHRRTGAIDISDRITPELLSKLQEKDWNIQKEGLEEVASILQDARHIQPNIGELPRALRVCLHDPNPSLVQMALRVLQHLCTAMGSNITQHMKDLGLPLIALFRESKRSTRAAALAAVNAWAAQLDISQWLGGQDGSGELGEEMPFQKQELVRWVAEELPTLRSAPLDLLRCVPLLFSCLQDGNGDVLTASQAALPFFIMHLGFEKMAEATSELKVGARDHILAILENANASLSAQPTASVESLSGHPTDNTTPILPSVPTTPPATTTLSSQASAEEPAPKLSQEQKQGPKEPTSGEEGVKDMGAAKGKAQAKPTLKDGGSNPVPIFIVVPRGKEQRMRDEKGRKVLQWNFTAPNKRYIEQLKAQMSSCVSRSFQVELFHPSFLHQIKALAMMIRHLETEKEGVISCLDLILKWLTLRFFDSNMWVLIKSLEYLNLLLTLLIQEKYQLTENEALSFLPYLVLKMGDPRKVICKLVHAVLKGMCLVYPPKKVFSFLMEGIKFQNAKQQAGCLVEMGYLLEVYGLEVCEPSPDKALKRIAAFLRDKDRAVHNAALNIMVTACKTHGEVIFRIVGVLPKEYMRMLGQTAEQEPGRPQVSPAKHLCEKPHQELNSSCEGICQQAGGAPSKPEPTSSEGGNLNKVVEAPRSLPPRLGQHEGRLVSRKYRHLKLRDIIQLETIPEFQTLPTSSDTDDTCRNITPTINSLICGIRDSNAGTSIQAVEEIEKILRQKNNAEAMAGHVNEFLVASFQPFKLIPKQKESDEKLGKDQIILRCKGVVQAMMFLFQEKKLAQEASMEVLKDVMHNLLTLMLEFLEGDQEEDQKLIQSINVLMRRVLEKSDQTRIFCALLKLLQGSLSAKDSPDKFSDLLAKCLWRTTRLLPSTISTIDLDKILLDVNTLLKSIPKEKLRRCTNELPLRTLKTLLHTLCKLKGARILDHLTLIEDAAGSEVEAYLRKTSYLNQSLAVIRTEPNTREHLPPPNLGTSPVAEAAPLGPTGIPGGTLRHKETTAEIGAGPTAKSLEDEDTVSELN
ncbi:cytoskeleton-associated protein 5-like [Oxyura jamaicensis]|uniref:cytoskeleton-associated protein 5-like n=1 Tax=Oxyura jamaicensis TaxID=8884 RepID=UPI0015A655AB|nr:cytoskeleton-associated protein 5-like [Oxyura jamaicensis]